MARVGGPPLWLSMIVLQADWLSERGVTGSPPSSVSQLFGPGLLHNYIKAWSTGQPQHTGYKYDDNSSLHSCAVRALSAASYPCSCASALKEALHQSPRVICVTSYINTHDGVSGFQRRRSIFTGGWSPARVYLCLRASLRCSLDRVFRVFVWVKSSESNTNVQW